MVALTIKKRPFFALLIHFVNEVSSGILKMALVVMLKGKFEGGWKIAIVFGHQASIEMQEMALTVKFGGQIDFFVFCVTFGIKGL